MEISFKTKEPVTVPQILATGRPAMKRFKRWLRRKIMNALYATAYLQVGISRYHPKNSVLILPPADTHDESDTHSFGDRMILLGLLGRLRDKFSGAISVLSRGSCEPHRLTIDGHNVTIVGFSKRWTSFSSYREFIGLASACSHFVLIGEDALDGIYGEYDSVQMLRFVRLACVMGLKSVVVGCSFNGTPDRKIRNLFRRAERSGTITYARDPVSLDRFRTFLNNAKPVADLAFGVDAEKFPLTSGISAIRMRSAAWKKDSGIILGINFRAWSIRNKDRFLDDIAAEILALNDSERKLALILIPHDTRRHNDSDLAFLQEFNRRLGNRIEIIGSPEEIASGIHAKQAVRCCDVVLTGRMHVAIAALDQGIPAVSFSYQGKFEGLYDLFGMGRKWLVEYEDPQGAIRILRQALDRREELSANIVARIQDIRSSADRNVEWLNDDKTQE